MEKSNNYFGDVEDYSCELPNFQLMFICRASTDLYLRDFLINLSRLVMHTAGILERVFQRFGDNKIQHKLYL